MTAQHVEGDPRAIDETVTTSTQTNDQWRSGGLCNGSEVAVFYPTADERSVVAKAKAICSLCPVKQRCFEHAMSAREPAGVWGGTDEWERRRQWRIEGNRLRS